MKTTRPGARVISIGGGKGGVGKSLVATNLAVAIAQTGREVVLCDLDLGAANLHLMLGATQPKAGIAALLAPESTLDDALTDTKVERLRLLAGAGGTVASANITHAQKLRIIRKLRALKTEFVVVDVGAGVGYNALDFFELGQQRVIVATPQVTSMHDAYAFLKGAVLRTLRHHAGRSNEAWMLDPAMASKDGEKVKDLLLRIRDQDPAVGEKIAQILKHFGAFLVGNQVDNPNQVGVFQAVSRMVEDFLGISLPILGWIPAHPRLADSVNERMPFMARPEKADSREARAFRAVVEGLLVGDMAPEEELLVELVDEEAGFEAPPTPTMDPASPDIGPLLARHAALAVSASMYAPPPPPPVQRPSALSGTLSPRGPVAPGAPPPPPGRPVASEPSIQVAPQVSPPMPPPVPAAARSGDLPALPNKAVPAATSSDEMVMPRIYVRPGRKRKVDPEEKKRRRALDAEGRRRKLTLPGMPPSRAKNP
ncbi:MAG TPA: P-loop NTPase [Polyangia bacterium]